ncbi:MAG: UDP-glucose/GDP-mannose dehydrogenase family protein [Desulfobacula sp.]|uniref:UDP-glucose dehydrogenase family protein n=1 Tax=Desulfobacula sp. TaxID=2593537 RepID=UPI0025C445A7|nr:UDP-glucose/GDP-mannose dehydrogenase family protein [Desulfobacula sp.]MCD4719372.1 UDP-glucose/GDP-mannose dehydrogenase family protein [Desulfobacula sp.]
MKLTIIGTGYVGLVTGACFAEMGSTVTCVDIDKTKIDNLKKGILPIYEPGLENLVIQNYKEGTLKFSTSLEQASKDSNIFFIAVGTPPGEDGSADLQYVLQVAKEIGQNINDHSVIVDKSTVPVGTADKVKSTIRKELEKRGVSIEFDVVSNPEFLKEGAAVNDFLKPDRIVIGADSQRAEKMMKRLYAPFSRNREKVISMNVRDAEMTKYAANSMLATKISFMNEISNICERLGVDVENVRKGIGSDSRIGYSFIYPGCGYGGSCFPKDVKALIKTSKDQDFVPELLNAVEKRNNLQKQVLSDKIIKRFGRDLSGKTFCMWGLSFKPGTDDMRDSSSTIILKELINSGASIKAFDPVAMDQARKEFPEDWFSKGQLKLEDSQYKAIENTDALILVTEWKTFRQPDFKAMADMMNQFIIFDGRNQYDPEEVNEAGFEYHGIGREKM